MLKRLLSRFRPFIDPSVLILLLVSAGPLLVLDRPMALTLLQWSLFVLAVGAITNLLSMVMLPEVKVVDLYRRVLVNGELAPAVLLGSLILFMGLVFLGGVLWARG